MKNKQNELVLYHGSPNKEIQPTYGLGNDKYEQKHGKTAGGFAPNWIGQFYALFQWIYRLPSKEVVKLLPVKFMFEAYPGLHDLDLYVAVRKVGEQCGLNVPSSC